MSAALRRPDTDSLDEANFSRIASLIGDTVGIKLSAQKRMMVEGRLRKRLKVAGFETANDYCHFVFENGGLESEFIHLVDAITTNKTDFFRESDHLDLLATIMVPELTRRRGKRPLLKVWSAACSNGSEAWSLAMVLDNAALSYNFDYAILGTDISVSVLEAARRAIYPAEALEPVPAALRARYTMIGHKGSLAGSVRIAPELRARARFERMNLMDPAYPYDRDVDIVFLRNVLIYFERSDQEAVIGRLVDHVRPKGYFVVGHSESMVVTDPRLRQIAPAVFQRVG